MTTIYEKKYSTLLLKISYIFVMKYETIQKEVSHLFFNYILDYNYPNVF